MNFYVLNCVLFYLGRWNQMVAPLCSAWYLNHLFVYCIYVLRVPASQSEVRNPIWGHVTEHQGCEKFGSKESFLSMQHLKINSESSMELRQGASVTPAHVTLPGFTAVLIWNINRNVHTVTVQCGKCYLRYLGLESGLSYNVNFSVFKIHISILLL